MRDGGRFQRDIADRQVAMFGSFVGRGLFITRAALSAASGIPESTLREYAGGASIPLHAVLALAPHLPAAAINLLFEPAGKRLVDAEGTATNWDALAAGASGLTFEICEAREDGQVDHVEDARLKRRARVLRAQLDGLIGDDA